MNLVASIWSSSRQYPMSIMRTRGPNCTGAFFQFSPLKQSSLFALGAIRIGELVHLGFLTSSLIKEHIHPFTPFSTLPIIPRLIALMPSHKHLFCPSSLISPPISFPLLCHPHLKLLIKIQTSTNNNIPNIVLQNGV